MEKDLTPLLHFQILAVSWSLIGISAGFVLTCLLFVLRETRDRRRPGINIKGL